MKRLTTIFLSLTALFLILAGCSSTSKEKEGNDDTLIIGIDDKFAPMGFRDEDNKIVGFDIDYAKAAAEKMGVKVEFQPIDWKTKESELSSGRIDLIWNGYTITDERKKKVLFTKPYLKNAQVVVTLKDSKLSKLADLNGKVVGLQSLSSASDALDANPIKSKIKEVTEFSDNVMALNDLKSGRLDAVVIDEVVIDYYMTAEKLSAELEKTDTIIKKFTGFKPSLYRPVGGIYNDVIINTAIKNRKEVVLWSWNQDPRDWANPSAGQICNYVTKGIKPGNIILFHDWHGSEYTQNCQTVHALDNILEFLYKNGYKCVTVSELLYRSTQLIPDSFGIYPVKKAKTSHIDLIF